METIYVLAAAALIVIVFGILGSVRGFVKMVYSFASLFLTFFLVWQIYPHVDMLIRTNTGIHETVREKSIRYISDELEKQIGRPGSDAPSNAHEAGEELLNNSWLSIIRDYSGEAKDQPGAAENLAVAVVAERIGTLLAHFIIKLVAFAVAFALISIALHIIGRMLEIVTRLPVIHTLNKTAGAFLGVLEGVVVVWILMIIAIVFFNTTFGAAVLRAVNENSIFAAIYRVNPLLWFLVKN